MDSSTYYVIESGGLDGLFSALRERGYALIGPTVRDNTIVYDEIGGVEDLPIGWVDEQSPGRYRINKRNDQAFFGFNIGPHSWKKFLFPPSLKLFDAIHREDGVIFVEDGNANPNANAASGNSTSGKLAFIGVRACELNAILVQDKVLATGIYTDSYYASLRRDSFILAVNCGQSVGTCFCTSMNTGPRVESGYDILITEVLGRRHYFVVQVGSEKGREILGGISYRDASHDEIVEAGAIVNATAASITKKMDTSGVKALLQGNPDHPQWDVVANRCLSCANCTLVCPTCFCHTIEDTTDLTGNFAERWRKWDSCFALDFSYIHGGSIRTSRKARYRQWLTHKLANWIDQFGTSGCVGCGRCITWCPVGIDITEEVRAIQETAARPTIRNSTEVNHHGIS